MDIIIVPLKEWPVGKLDPTEYNYDTLTANIREDYPISYDPAGWIVHEQAHHTLHLQGVIDNNDPYPFNNIEKIAYIMQFVYLITLGYISFEDVLKTYTWEHKIIHRDPLAQYFKEAIRKKQKDFK